MTTRPFPRRRAAAFAGVFVVLILAALATNPPWRRLDSSASVGGLSDRIDALLDAPFLEPVHVGVHVVALESGETLYDHAGARRFHPASNLKLLTALTALRTLPADHRFPARITADA